MADVRSVAAAIDTDRAALRMLADVAQQLRTAPLAGLGLGEHGDRAVQPDRQHIIVGAERGEDGTMLQIRAEAADPGGDRLAGFGMAADLARQRQQPKRGFEIDILGLHRTRQRYPLRLLAVLGLAELYVMTV